MNTNSPKHWSDTTRNDLLSWGLLLLFFSFLSLELLFLSCDDDDRYEDLASNPSNTSRQLFNWLGIQWRAEVDQYILNHTQYDDRDPHGTIRLLGSRIAPWTNWTKINSIQDTCRDALLSFGYYIPAALSNSTSPGISSSNNQTTFASVFKCNFLSTADWMFPVCFLNLKINIAKEKKTRFVSIDGR